MLPSSLNTPAAAALLSSEALNVVTSATHSVGAEESECESGAENESERDGEEDDDDSDDDCQIVLEQSGTADSTGASSAGTEAPAKKAKMTLTSEQEKFAKQFHPAASKIDQPRKILTRHVTGRGASMKKQGARRHDVKPGTLQKRLLNFPCVQF
jgi:flagellum-specific peptidoglycan hydrolase FlgJ